MLLITTKCCGAYGFTENHAQPNTNAIVACAPDCAGGCTDDHDHDEGAQSCPGNHPVCTDGDACKLALSPTTGPGDTCEVGHCFTGFKGATRPEGCTATCRPVKIALVPGTDSNPSPLVMRAVAG